MWRRSPRGSWVRESANKMSDSNDEYREAVENMALQVGDSVVAYTYPLTEGLIINRKMEDDGRLELSLLIAPFKKKGKAWSRAKVSVRDAARLSKKPPGKFLFPLKGVENLRMEAKRAKADPVWVGQVKLALDKEFAQEDLSSGDSDSEQKEEDERGLLEGEQSDNTLQKGKDMLLGNKRNEDLEKRVEEIKSFRERKESRRKPKSYKNREIKSDSSDYEEWKKWRRLRRKKKEKKNRRKQATSTSSASSSTSSSSSSSSEEKPKKGEVREKGASGMYTCPFNKFDTRGFSDVKCQIQGQTTTRKNIRMALHNLYANCHTLSGFADKLISKAYASANRPFTMDVAWFQAYAEHLDSALLNSLGGPWSLWNEPVVDEMLTGFLELMMRVSPTKNYPVCLDDTVRKWMKKKRIGTDTKFGPVTYAMQHAKFTEGGALVQQANYQRNKERPTGGSKQGITTGNKVNSFSTTSGEKRAPPPS